MRQKSIKNRSSLGEGLFFFNSMVLSVRTFPAKTCYSKYTESDNSHSVQIPLVRRKFHPERLFPKTAALWNGFPGKCFSDHYSVNIYKSSVKCFLSYISLWYALFTSFLYVLTPTSFRDPLPWAVLGPCIVLTVIYKNSNRIYLLIITILVAISFGFSNY